MMYKSERFHRTVGTESETTQAVDRRAETSLWPSRLHERFPFPPKRDDGGIVSLTGDVDWRLSTLETLRTFP
jgi:hypothetical protein